MGETAGATSGLRQPAEGEVDTGEHVAMRDAQRARRIIAVGGGKGGTGKSLIAANIGIYLAQLGKRVVLLDADLGGANLHTFVGVERPAVTIGDLFAKRVERIDDVVVPTSIAGLGLVSGEGDPSWIANPRPAQKYRLLNQVRDLEVDYLVVDLGPGSGVNALDFFLVADVGILVVVPEPTSVENTWRFIKSAFLRHARRARPEGGAPPPRETSPDGGIPAPLDLYLRARDAEPAAADRIFDAMRTFRPRIVVNECRTRGDQELGVQLASAGRRRLGVDVDYLGHVDADDGVWIAVRKRRPLLVEQPDSRASKDIERIVRRLLALETAERSAELAPSIEPNHYEILEVEPTASDEDIRRAVRRMREIYGSDSMVICGLCGADSLEKARQRVEEATDVLLDTERRRLYDQTLFPDGTPVRRWRTPPGGFLALAAASGPPASAAPAQAIGGERSAGLRPARAFDEPPDEPSSEGPFEEPPIERDTEFSGPLLRQVRRARGIQLQDISAKTKVGVYYLRAIEQERWDALPATVYLRGFLVEYARYLRLDASRVSQSFLARYRAARKDVD